MLTYHPIFVTIFTSFLHKERELVLSPYKAHTAKIHSNIFTEPPKYVKLHVITENSENRPEITEPRSRCLLPTGSEASDQESENIKSCGMPMPTYHPILIIIRWIKTQLFAQGTWTCVIPLWSHMNLIMGPTGPNKKLLPNLFSKIR